MSGARRRMPDFAGVALVDILANGVAMLIIIVVLSIATRAEREQRYAEQTDELATVMSHRFGTSLVLNSLAASPPARLHDYETSELDQVLDPQQLPILELHAGFVREFYSGAVWTRHDLLAEDNAMHAWLAGFSDLQRQRIRVDVYDVDQFYVAMAILREHGITVRHWHFVPRGVSLADAARCPPGVAAQDCPGLVAGKRAPANAPGLMADRSAPGGLLGPDWPPAGFPRGSGRGVGVAGAAPGPLPGGVIPGFAGAVGDGSGAFGESAAGDGGGEGEPGSGRGFGQPGASELGSFPNAFQGARGAGSGPRGRRGSAGGGRRGEAQTRFRIALPESIRQELDQAASFGDGNGAPSLETLFGVLLYYLRMLQDTLDSGGSPSLEVERFVEWLVPALAAPPPITEAERRIARNLTMDFIFTRSLGGPASRFDPLTVRRAPPGPGEDTVLVVAPNRPIEEVGVGRGGSGAELPAQARAGFRFNAYPGIWKGLHLTLEPHAALLMPPTAPDPDNLRWRALAYLSPDLDDFIVGFAFAAVDAEGGLRVQADANRARLDGQALFSEYRGSAFGARGWLVSLYAALAVGILLLALNRRFLTGRAA